jgi:hypothetical protein
MIIIINLIKYKRSAESDLLKIKINKIKKYKERSVDKKKLKLIYI